MNIKLKNNSSLVSYAQLDYIEGNGLCRISTDIPVDASTSIFVSIEQIDNFPSYQWLYSFIWGESPTAFGLAWDCGNAQTRPIQCYPGPKLASFDFPLHERHDIELYYDNGLRVKYDGDLIISNDKPIIIPKNSKFYFVLGGDYPHRYYRVIVKKSNSVVLDLIPFKDLNGVVCFYDKVSESFFYNQREGELVGGRVVSYVLPEDFSFSVTSMFHQNTPNINGLYLIDSILSNQQEASSVVLSNVRVDIGNVSGSYSELMRYSTLHGFNDNYEQQTKPRLVGTWTINDWYTSEQLIEAQSAFDGLTVVADSSYLIDFNELAIQTLDDTQPNYNPAVAIKLQSAGYGVTLNSPCVSGQEGRWFLKKTSAAAITAPKMNCTFNNVSSVTDSNGIVSNDKTVSYSFSKFNEYKYFIGLTHVPDSWFTNSNLSEITLPETITIIDTASPPYYYSGAFAQTKLSYIVFPSNVETLGVGVAYNTNLVFAQIKGNDVTLREFNNQDDPGSVGGFYNTSNICFGNGQKYNDAVLLEHHIQKSKQWSHYGSKLKSWYSYAAPNISYDGTNVTISVGRASTIYYTTDGSIPSTSSTQYTEPFIWNGISCIKAMALDTMYIKGDIVYADDFYATTTQSPVISNTSSQITISAESGATIYYTLDGSHPTLESQVYSGPITVTQEMGDFVKVRCFAKITGKNDSEIVAKICVIDDSKWGTDGDDSYFAVQCMDSTKPNYNPAACIILNNNSKLTDKCYGGGGYIAKTDAAALTSISTWFTSKVNITDNIGICGTIGDTYTFSSFDEFRFFTGITSIMQNYGTPGTFANCTALESIKLPNTLTKLRFNYPSGGFENCSSLLELDLSNVTIIEQPYGCNNCTNLKKVYYNDSVDTVFSHKCNSNLELEHLPTGLVNIPYGCFYGCNKITIQELPSGITTFGTTGGDVHKGTFSGCTSIPFLHLLRNTPPNIQYGMGGAYEQFYGTTFKFYVGNGSSAAHDDAILADYLADTNWATYSSRLDTWYNYLHPSV